MASITAIPAPIRVNSLRLKGLALLVGESLPIGFRLCTSQGRFAAPERYNSSGSVIGVNPC
jgi:hypothetical protein